MTVRPANGLATLGKLRCSPGTREAVSPYRDAHIDLACLCGGLPALEAGVSTNHGVLRSAGTFRASASRKLTAAPSRPKDIRRRPAVSASSTAAAGLAICELAAASQQLFTRRVFKTHKCSIARNSGWLGQKRGDRRHKPRPSILPGMRDRASPAANNPAARRTRCDKSTLFDIRKGLCQRLQSSIIRKACQACARHIRGHHIKPLNPAVQPGRA